MHQSADGDLGDTPAADAPSPRFATARVPRDPTVVAPDGSDVRVLLGVAAGGMAHFTLAPGRVSTAVRHRSVEEIWYVVAGSGQMWRRDEEGVEAVVELAPGTCLTIPLGTSFQFRAVGGTPLEVVGVTMPPWPGEDEAYAVPGHWDATQRDQRDLA